MQESRHPRDLFSLVTLVLVSWLVASTNEDSMPPLEDLWTLPRLPPSRFARTRRTDSAIIPIDYKLDAWSQYDNPEEGNKQEGDIKERPQSRKTFTRYQELLWPNGVVKYHVDTRIANEPKVFAMLMRAMGIIMSKTCVKFKRIYPDENGRLPNNGWVNITSGEYGCYSDLGRSPYGSNILNLNLNKCFRVVGHAIHEMLHTLGVYHEHMRPDRDDHISIEWQNIRPGDSYNFRILNNSDVTDYGLPYDYDSIMHYSMTAFSKDKTVPTIIPKHPHKSEIGQRDHLSHYDIQKLLITYNCTGESRVKPSKTMKEPNKSDKRRREKHKISHKHHGSSKGNLGFEIKQKSEIILTIQRAGSNKIEDGDHIDLKDLDRNGQVIYVKHKYHVWPRYCPVPLIYFPLYRHVIRFRV